MKLYFNALSSNSRRARAVVHHLGLKVEEVSVDFTDLRKELLKLNPNAKIPVLVDGDFALWESNAIMQYLCEKSGDTTLWPRDLKARADITKWQFWVASHLGPSVAMVNMERVFKKRFRPDAAPDESIIRYGLDNWNRFAAVLDQHVQSRQWLVGSAPTLADYAVAAPLMYMTIAELPTDPYPNLVSWTGRVAELPGWTKTAMA